MGATLAATAPFACPACRMPLDGDGCEGCGRSFPGVAGLPDYRLAADRFLDLPAERAKAARLARVAEGTDLAGLAGFYYAITPDVEPRRRGHYLGHILGAEARGAALARLLPGSGRILEVGCGTGGLLAAARATGRDVTGVDVASRWLVVARRRLDDRGLAAPLVAADAARLPWPDGRFDCVVSDSLMEHLDDPAAALREFARVLRPGGSLLVWSPNRFSLGVDPHVRLWGLGYLPRRWMPAYVRWRRGAMWPARCLSPGEARRMAVDAGFGAVAVEPPAILAEWAESRPASQRAMIQVYESMRRSPVIGPMLLGVGPLWQLRATRKGAA